jgi:predicted ATPase/class 3 adenylate cyclase/DNA-binding CsgD family transcriptional regulator
MIEIDPVTGTPSLNWGELGMVELPTGTVTLLLADVEGSTRLWETEPGEMASAIARLDRTLCELIAAHDGVRPVEQGEGDSFVLAFARASDAVGCALDLQRAALAPIRLRIGVHTGEIQLRDEGNYIGPTINRTARLRDLAHGGQTVLSGAAEALVVDRLPTDAWLIDLGTHPLRDLPRPEHVAQLCHPDVRNDFPPLRTPQTTVNRLPLQLTSFVGRHAQIEEIRWILVDNRLVTLAGAGGVGKTRLAVEIAGAVEGRFAGGTCYVELASITDPELVPVAVARALGLPDQPGRSTMDTIRRSVGDREVLLLLDNCEHLLDACAALVVAVVDACPNSTFLTTSREPIGITGEVTWRVPSLSQADEAVQLFTDRARLARPDFHLSDDAVDVVIEICRRLDGMPLAIELAAARVRALSLDEINDSLHDRFRLLTGGSRTAVRRQQTLRASVDWSHALLTGPERVLFRRLAAFMGGFALDAAQAVCSGGEVEAHQVLDQLSLLVDKSLVVVENHTGRTRYRLLETVRQYALERLSESGEADCVRTRHRDHYTAKAALLDVPANTGHDRRLEQVEDEIDNLRAAFTWSRESRDVAQALQLASSLQLLWLARGRLGEGLSWFDAALADLAANRVSVTPAVGARALADRAMIDASVIATDCVAQAEEALAIARELDDPALLARTLTARGCVNGYEPAVAAPYFAEAMDLARALNDGWTVSLILGWQGLGAFMTGYPSATREAAEEGRRLADQIGDRFNARLCRWCLATAQLIQGDLTGSAARSLELVVEAKAAHDSIFVVSSLRTRGHALARLGDTAAAVDASTAAIAASAELGGWHQGLSHQALASAALAAGDVSAAEEAVAAAVQRLGGHDASVAAAGALIARVALARGDLVEARRCADQAVRVTSGWHLASALAMRARIAAAQGETDQAERDAHAALTAAADSVAYLEVDDILECLAAMALRRAGHEEAVRLLGAADGIRRRTGSVRFHVDDAGHEDSVTALRDAMSDEDFASRWEEGAAMSTEEGIAYAQRGRGGRKRPSSGWASLTPTELDVVKLVAEGLTNKDVAARLFISPRTVQAHLAHVFAKLGVTTRTQLAQEVTRRTTPDAS